MGNDIRQQLAGLGMAVLLGMNTALLYDVLRPFRVKKRTWRALTHVLDALFAAVSMLLFLRLATSLGAGQLRLYMLLGGIVGAVIWWAGPSALWRQVWGFWLSTAAQLVRRVVRPLFWLGEKVKKVFSFLRKWSTIVGRVNTSAEEDVS